MTLDDERRFDAVRSTPFRERPLFDAALRACGPADSRRLRKMFDAGEIQGD